QNASNAVLEMLIAAGADCHWADVGECNAIMVAAAQGHLATIKILFQSMGEKTVREKIDLLSDADMSALMYAAQNGELEMLELLLKAGANVNLRSNAGLSAVAHAARHGRRSAVQLLLDAGADPDTGEDALDNTPKPLPATSH
ncbi:MAG: ankyrin repeat domain-containing protein, partial [Janthinobacterium lividum]